MRKMLLAMVAASVLAGCSLRARPALAPGATTTCRSTVPQAEAVRWSAPIDAIHRARLDAWCAGVGPALFRPEIEPPVEQGDQAPEDVALVSWNVHVGAGDVEQFIADLRAGRLSGGRPVRHLILMLQEAVRSGGVPPVIPAGAAAAKWIGSDQRAATDVDDVARRLGLALLYVPSMRNGSMAARGHAPSDRGGAILSTLPLAQPAAIELPGARQRRVAVSARIVLHTAEGETPVSIGALHLDVLGPPHTLWIFGAASSRARQARSLIDALPEGPVILGADLNNWFGPDEQALRVLRRSFPSTPTPSHTSTFRGGLVLDYLLFRLPQGWHARVTRAPERYGSDHYPLIGWIERTR